MIRTRLIVANWKMNPATPDEAHMIAKDIRKRARSFGRSRIVICPPFLFLEGVSHAIARARKMALGAQDVFVGAGAAHTGEIGPDMLKKSGAKYVIIGHSEKRAAGDTDDIVKTKLLGALLAGLSPILCIGEAVRNDHGDHYKEIRRELLAAIEKLPKKLAKKLIIAYEPVWAIGKSEKDAMQPAALREMAIFIRKILHDVFGKANADSVPILYGGSVTKGNGESIVKDGNVDGLLVGRESLHAESFADLAAEIGK